jgi:hypothetical protein
MTPEFQINIYAKKQRSSFQNFPSFHFTHKPKLTEEIVFEGAPETQFFKNFKTRFFVIASKKIEKNLDQTSVLPL